MREIDIRRAILKWVNDQHAADADTLVLEELGICEGAARVDVAVVNGQIHGFEIKSPQDSLARLASQVDFYSRALDRVTLVTDAKHLPDAVNMIPAWWGVITAAGRHGTEVNLRQVRVARQNPSPDDFARAQFLWRDEVLAELQDRQLDRGVRNKARKHLWERLAQELTPSELGDVVRTKLKRRSNWRVEARRE